MKKVPRFGTAEDESRDMEVGKAAGNRVPKRPRMTRMFRSVPEFNLMKTEKVRGVVQKLRSLVIGR